LSAVTASAVRRLLSMARRKHRQPAGADTGDTVAATVAAATTPAAAVGDAIALDESSGDGDLGGGRKSDGSGGRPEGKRPVKPKRVASKGQWGKGLEKRAALKASREKLAEHLVRQYGEQDARDRLSALTIWKDMQHGHIPSAAARKIYWRKLQQMLAVDSDAVVARVTAIRWASFAKSSDPNDDLWGSKQGALEWPIWFDDHQHSDNSNFERHGSGSGGGSMGGSRSSGSSGDGGGGDDTNNYREEGGGGGGFISEGVFIIPEEVHDTETDDSRHDDEWARHGSTARAGGGSGAGVAPNDEGAVKHSRGMQQTQQQQEKQRRRSVYTRWDGGPEYLEIGNPNLIRHVGRDCFCEFWDSLEYAH